MVLISKFPSPASIHISRRSTVSLGLIGSPREGCGIGLGMDDPIDPLIFHYWSRYTPWFIDRWYVITAKNEQKWKSYTVWYWHIRRSPGLLLSMGEKRDHGQNSMRQYKISNVSLNSIVTTFFDVFNKNNDIIMQFKVKNYYFRDIITFSTIFYPALIVHIQRS